MAVVGGGDWAGVKHAASTHAGSAQTQTVIRHSPPHPRVALKSILNLISPTRMVTGGIGGRGIPGQGSLDRSCAVMVRKCRRHVDPCPGGTVTDERTNDVCTTAIVSTKHIAQVVPGLVVCQHKLVHLRHHQPLNPAHHCGVSNPLQEPA